MRSTLFLTALCLLTIAAQATPDTILDIQITNFVNYDYDYLDYTKFATVPSVTTPLPMRTFGRHMALGDIAGVNGKPAKGTCVFFSRMLNLRPDAASGQAIADVTRVMLDDFACEFLQAEGPAIGTIMGYGFTNGAAPPGAPRAVTAFDYAVLGGTGAFLGARGQGGYAGPAPSRVASVYEDPAARRALGGTSRRFVVHLIPMSQPAVVLESGVPVLFHASDLTPVTAQNPAQAGEVLAARVLGLGPVRPAMDPGDVFPEEPLAVVNSPVEVTINGQPAAVVGQVGWPGTSDAYRVDFRVPEGAAAGAAGLRVAAAWVQSPEVVFAIR